MARIPDILYIGQPGTSNTSLYTVPSSTQTTITAIHVTNTNSATKYFSLHIKQSGDTVADDVAIAHTIKLAGTSSSAGGGTWTWEIPLPLMTVGDVLNGIQETATACTVTIIGFTEAV